MADPQVNVLGQDLYALGYVDSLKPIQEKKTFQKDKFIINNYNLKVKNFDNTFSIDNPDSLFNNLDWRYETIQVINEDSEVVWNGVITDIIRNPVSKTATIESKDSLYKQRKEIITYTSSDWETGATAAKNIMDAADFTAYDTASIETSIANLISASCYLKVNITLEDNITLLQILDKLAVYSGADCYLHANNIYFKHWKPFTGGVSITLDDTNINDITDIRSNEKELINDYSIGYDGDLGTPATDANSNNIGSVSRSKYGTHSLPEMRCEDENSQIWFKDKTSATYIGETYIKRTNINYTTQPRPLTSIKCNLKYNLESWITLENIVYVTFSDEGWTNKIFEVFEFTRNEENKTLKATLFEVIT